MRRLGTSGVWETSSRASASAPATSTRSSEPTAAGTRRPTRWRAPELPPATPPSSPTASYEWDDEEWMAGPRQRRTPHAPDVGLRGAPRLVGPHRARGSARLPPSSRSSSRTSRTWLHARGVPAADGAPVRRILGLPGHLLLRARLASRRPGRAAPAHRPAPPGGHRRDPRLGARALPPRQLRAAQLRRHRPLRARRSPPGRARRTGAPDLQLRPQRGAQLPRRQRPVLARGVPHRRPAGRRRGLDALPRLLAQGRRVDPEPVRRPREPGGDRLPAGDEHRRLRRVPGRR